MSRRTGAKPRERPQHPIRAGLFVLRRALPALLAAASLAGCATSRSPLTPAFGYSKDCKEYCQGVQKKQTRTETYVGIGMMAVGAGAAGVGIWKLGQASERRDQAGGATTMKLNERYNDQADRYQEIASWTLPIGGAVLIAGAVLLAIGNSRGKPEDSATDNKRAAQSVHIVPCVSDQGAPGIAIGGTF